MQTDWRGFSVILVSIAILSFSELVAEDVATAKQAAAVLDLSTFPLIEPAGQPNAQRIATQSYVASGTATQVAQKIKEALLQKGLRELEGATYTEGYCSASFEGSGFRYSLSVTPSGPANQMQVNLYNHGNVDLVKLPVPSGFTLAYTFPAVTSYVTDQSVDAAKAECRKLLEKEGWEPFGDTTVSFFVKKNAVRLQVMATASPAQGGKTSVQLSSEQLSVDLPSPPQLEWLQYADTTAGMQFRSGATKLALVDFFKESLGGMGWKPTTDSLVKVGFREALIFRSPTGEMIDIEFSEVDGKINGDLRYKTAAEFAALDQQAKAKAAEMQQKLAMEEQRKKNPPTLKLPAMPNARVEESSAKQIELAARSGTAKSIVDAWIAKRVAEGWKHEATVDTKEVSDHSLTKDGATVTISVVDPGFIPAQITVSVREEYKLELTP